MTDIFFTDAGEAPVPPAEVRLRELTVVPRRDAVRVDVTAGLTPFQKRPNIEVTITNAAGEEVAALSVVEAVEATMDFTMHIRESHPKGSYKLVARVFYADIEANQPAATGEATSGEILHQAKEIVDERSLEFHIPAGDSQN